MSSVPVFKPMHGTESFPLGEREITWCVDAPELYDLPHLGHARMYVTIDIIRRIMTNYFNYNVNLIMNVNNIEEKAVARRDYLFAEFLHEAESKSVESLFFEIQETFLFAKSKQSREIENAHVTVCRDISDLENYSSLMNENELKCLEFFKNNGSSDSTIYDKRINNSISLALKIAKDVLIDKIVYDLATHDNNFDAFSSFLYKKEFISDMKALGVLPADSEVRTSEHRNKVHFYSSIHLYNLDIFDVKHYLHVGRLIHDAHEKFSSIRNTLQAWSSVTIRMYFLSQSWHEDFRFSVSGLIEASRKEKQLREFFSKMNSIIYNAACKSELWINSDRLFYRSYSANVENIHKALLDNFNYSSAFKFLFELVGDIMVYCLIETCKLSLVRKATSYLDRMFRLFGIFEGSSLGFVDTICNLDDTITSVLDIFSTFRYSAKVTVMSIIKEKNIDDAPAIAQALLQSCKSVNENLLSNNGIQIEDCNYKPSWKFQRPRCTVKNNSKGTVINSTFSQNNNCSFSVIDNENIQNDFRFRFSEEMLNFYSSIVTKLPSDENTTIKLTSSLKQFLYQIYDLVIRLYPYAHLELYGSSISNSTISSDVDAIIQFPADFMHPSHNMFSFSRLFEFHQSTEKQVDNFMASPEIVLQKLHELIESEGIEGKKNNLLIVSPSVCVLKLMHPISYGIQMFYFLFSNARIDITALRGTEQRIKSAFFKLVFSSHEGIRPLSSAVKYWAKNRGIGDASVGGINSYGWCLCLLFHLSYSKQISIDIPALVERLHYIFSNSIELSENDISNLIDVHEICTPTFLHDSLLSFFSYFAFNFPYKDSRISVRKNQLLPRMCNTLKKNQNFEFIIEDIFDVSDNVARGVTQAKLKFIIDEFQRAYNLMIIGAGFSQVCEIDDFK